MCLCSAGSHRLSVDGCDATGRQRAAPVPFSSAIQLGSVPVEGLWCMWAISANRKDWRLAPGLCWLLHCLGPIWSCMLCGLLFYAQTPPRLWVSTRADIDTYWGIATPRPLILIGSWPGGSILVYFKSNYRAYVQFCSGHVKVVKYHVMPV